MTIRPDCATIVFLVLDMMHKAKDRLEEEQDEHNDADDRMVVVQQVVGNVVHHPYAKAKGDNICDVREELEDAMDEPDAAEGAKTNENGANGEKEYKSKSSEDAMCGQHLLS